MTWRWGTSLGKSVCSSITTKMATQAARSAREGLSRATQAGSSSATLTPSHQRRNVLLRGIPRTVLAADIHRALKDAGAVDSEFSLDNITAEPPYLAGLNPVAPPITTRTFHITTPSAGHATELRSFLYKRSLFAASNQGIDITSSSRKDWARSIIERAAARAAKAGQHKALEKVDARKPEPIDVDWLQKSGFRGRRVLLTGTPGKVARERLEVLASGCEMQNLTQIPPQPRSLFSAHIFTFPSVALAYKFHRRVHMTHYDRKNWNSEFLLRSEVQW